MWKALTDSCLTKTSKALTDISALKTLPLRHHCNKTAKDMRTRLPATRGTKFQNLYKLRNQIS